METGSASGPRNAHPASYATVPCALRTGLGARRLPTGLCPCGCMDAVPAAGGIAREDLPTRVVVGHRDGRDGTRPHPARPAFTRIELLMGVGIIPVLMGLALRAVRGVRESANRVQCADHVKQLGPPLRGRHDTRSAFRSGGSWGRRLIILRGSNARVFESTAVHHPPTRPTCGVGEPDGPPRCHLRRVGRRPKGNAPNGTEGVADS